MWSLKGKRHFIAVDDIDGVFLVTEKRMKQGDDATFVYKEDDIETLHRELHKDKQELQDKILARIAGLLSPPLPPEYTNPTNTSQLRLDISAIINEEFRKFEERMNERFDISD